MGKNRRNERRRHPIQARPGGQPPRAPQGLTAPAFGKVPRDPFRRFRAVRRPSAIARARHTDPAAYVRAVASLLPKQSEKLPNLLSEFTDDELERLERILAREPSSDTPGEGEADA
jgi:hypothetical protein